MENVIFDTNAYRYLVQDKNYNDLDNYIEKIKSKERRLGIETLLSPIVAKELLAHVADKNDPAFDKCLKAIKAMYLHCSQDEGKTYRMLAGPEMLIAKSFFNKMLPRQEQSYQALVQIAFHLAKEPTNYIFTKFQKNLNLIKMHVLEAENVFANTMLSFIKHNDPDSVDWNIFKNDKSKRTKLLNKIRSEETSLELAGGYIAIVHKLLQQENIITTSLDVNTLRDMSIEFVKFFPAYITLYKKVFENVINSDFNMFEDSRSNFLWDIQLMLNTGIKTINGNKLYFVSSDKAISDAVKNTDQYSILSFKEYLQYIN